MGKRFGPLHATEQGVRIGDPTRRHLLLAEDGIHHVDGEKRLATFAWEHVENVRLGCHDVVPLARGRRRSAVGGGRRARAG
ncbi:hypothetical protein E4U02_08320 [Microbacterium paludicola]|uniref:Uncharacterized protein n=1 Tax=Microbacterium paludicola TaxID=300019 RepID=A0A4Y9FVD7_9MICO|nr:hypothetical protein [Microbacterium paludicola]MBF0816412.1 hypothetical protein [Microbacterium paludicola]TFU32947.1 hypothetical protein E4U02_08320 [Microbacterium paludicola]